MSGSASRFDVIVVGCGGMGSATLYHLARRGVRVLGLEQFDIPHAMGSSHGVTRIIRLAYYEDPSYVPLLRRSYELWRELQREAGEQILHITGSIDASEPGGEVFSGSLRSCELHDLPHEVLSGDEVNRRFPGYRLLPDHQALLQPEGGFLLPERCIVAHVEGALAAGAEIHAREQVLDWNDSGSRIEVRTDRSTYHANAIVFTAGAWMGSLLPGVQALVQPERQVLAWLQPRNPSFFAPDVFPVFNLTVKEGRYYGFPIFGVPGFKVGRYHHLQEAVDPANPVREPDQQDEDVLREFTRAYFPDADGPVMTLKACMFTNTPDEHFIVDRLPSSDRVTIVSPCSGHGFKFCSVVGEIAADLALDRSTRHDISLFAMERFGTTANWQ
jgi:sarcosine oxidase